MTRTARGPILSSRMSERYLGYEAGQRNRGGRCSPDFDAGVTHGDCGKQLMQQDGVYTNSNLGYICFASDEAVDRRARECADDEH